MASPSASPRRAWPPGATRPSERAWRSLSGRPQRRPRPPAAAKAAFSAGIPAGVWLLNRVLRADFGPDLSAA